MDINYNELIYLESICNIKLFQIKNNVFILRNIDKIIYDCNRMIKKKLIELSTNIKNITLGNMDINIIKEQCITYQEKTLYDISNLQNIISIINNIMNLGYTDKSSLKNYYIGHVANNDVNHKIVINNKKIDDFIEVYSN